MALHRKIRYWKLRSTELQLGEKTVLMGVLNVTPDSFSDGGKFLDPDKAYARALEMEQEGADIIDIGAESTRPDSKRISADEEWQRLVPVLKRLRDKLRIPLSIDTYKSEIAERALDYGVEIVNDPSGLTFDPNIAKVAAQADAALILNHMRGTPETWSRLAPISDVMGSVVRELDAMASRARLAGVEKYRLVLDPGLGFGKRKEQNSEVIAQLGRLVALDYPVMVGASRKAFLMALAESEPGYATAAAVAASILNGADIVRVHDVKAMRAVALVADEIVRTDAASVRLVEAEADKAADAAAKLKRPKKDWLEPERRNAMRAPLAAKSAPVVSEKVETEPAPAEAMASDVATPVGATLLGGDAVEPLLEVGEADVTEKKADSVQDERSVPEVPPASSVGGDRPVPRVYNKPQGDKPRYQNDRPQGDRPRERPQGDRPRYGGDRPQGDRPRFGGDRSQYGGDRPQYGGDRPRYGGDRPQAGGDRPRFGGDRPQYGGDRPRYGGDRPQGDRPQGDRPGFGGDRPGGDRPQGDRPRFGGDRPQYGGDRPRYGGDRPQRGGDRPGFGGDRPPRRFEGDGPPRRNFSDRPPRPQGDRPQYGDRPSGPPRGDGPPRRFEGDRPGFKPGGFKPGGYQGSRSDGPPRSGGDRPGGDWKDRGPRPGGDSRPSGGRPPFGDKGRPPNRPFRKRP